MTVCPIANSVGCEKCAVVKICLLRSVLGNYDAETTEQANSTESEYY